MFHQPYWCEGTIFMTPTNKGRREIQGGVAEWGTGWLPRLMDLCQAVLTIKPQRH